MQNKPIEIVVNDKSRIFEIQDEFHTSFPYLTIKLFPEEDGNTLSLKKSIDITYKTLEQFRKNSIHEKIVITPAMTVADLGQLFSRIYNLEVHLFRKSGKTWLEATMTDAWALEEQNKQGESLSKKFRYE